MDGVCVTLDCSLSEFLTPERAVVSLKGGELYVISLLVQKTGDNSPVST
jgi:hypothetical protein